MVALNELSVVMGVGPVREQNVCFAMVQHKPKEGSLWWKIYGGTGAHTHQGLNFCGRHQMYPRTQATSGKVPIFTTNTVACSSEHGLGIFKCLSDSHVGCHSAMASAFILAKSSRSLLKKLPDRLIPAAAIGNGDRPPSPQGEGGNYGQDMLPPSPSLDEQARERIERREGLGGAPHLSMAGLDPDDSKEAERPAGNQALPTVSNPGARGWGWG
jgi:hypothetical protein